MATQFKFFMIPVKNVQTIEEQINTFLASAKIVNIEKDFHPAGEKSFWYMSVEYLKGKITPVEINKPDISFKKRPDYREILPPEEFEVFAKLREWRKSESEKTGVQLYNIFKNEQLSQIVTQKITSKTKLAEISGIGNARVTNYGDAVIKIMTENMYLLKKSDDEKKK